jgi:hypothetical protein
VCNVSSQSSWAHLSWAQSANTVAGSSAGTAGSDLFSLNAPVGFYYDQASHRMIVADSGNQRVIQFSLANPSSGGTILAGGNGAGCNLNQFTTAIGVVLDSFGQLYVSDSGCSRILKFPPNSNSSTFGVLVSNVTEVLELAINPLTGDLYAAGYWDSAIYLFAQNSTTGRVVAGT